MEYDAHAHAICAVVEGGLGPIGDFRFEVRWPHRLHIDPRTEGTQHFIQTVFFHNIRLVAALLVRLVALCDESV